MKIRLNCSDRLTLKTDRAMFRRPVNLSQAENKAWSRRLPEPSYPIGPRTLRWPSRSLIRRPPRASPVQTRDGFTLSLFETVIPSLFRDGYTLKPTYDGASRYWLSLPRNHSASRLREVYKRPQIRPKQGRFYSFATVLTTLYELTVLDKLTHLEH